MTHKPPRSPFTGSGRMKEGGFLATHKQDFNSHHSGTSYRHGGRDVDMEPELSQLGGVLAAPNVQETLEKIADILGLGVADANFVSIGDGTISTNSTFTVGSIATPTVKDAFDAAFADSRLVNGGIILLNSGTYRIVTTVIVPPGITVMGEMAGTRVICETVEKPMFTISRSILRPDMNQGAANTLDAVDRVTFFNMSFFDNLDGVSPNLTTVPMIELERGANFICEKMTFMGRMDALGGSPLSRDKTLEAIGYSASAGSANNSVLKVEKCFFDNMSKAIDFNTTGVGNSLSVTDCRARTYGTDAGSTAIGTFPQYNCFVSFNNGEIRLMNNYHVGSGIRSIAAYVITGASVERVIVSGTTGGLDDNQDLGKLITYSGSLIILQPTQTMLTSNSWGNWYNGGFTITVGDGIQSVGDFTGPLSLDTVMALQESVYSATSASNRPLPSTVIVHVGVYEMFTVGTNGAPMIMRGIPQNGLYPILNLNDSLVFGQYTSGIYFRSIGAIRNPFFGFVKSPAVEIDDCIFEDCAVGSSGLTQPTTHPDTELDLRSFFRMTNCRFNQTGTFADTTSFEMLGTPNNFLMKDCYFNGNGAALTIKDAGVSTPLPTIVSIENCEFNLADSTITTAASPNYIHISGELRVNITNCKAIVSNDGGLTSTTPIDAGLLASFTDFILIQTDEIYISGCLFNGPQQASINVAMPTLQLTPKRGLWFDNNRVDGGALPLQITAFGSEDVLEDEFDIYGISITNSEFSSFTNETSGTLTLLDIDYDTSFSPAESVPKITLNNCKFEQRLGGLLASMSSSTVYQVNHTDGFTDHYDTQGIVQIYAGASDITVSNCFIKGLITPHGLPDASSFSYNNLAGLVIDGYNHFADDSLEGKYNSINVHDNMINVVSGYDRDDGHDFVAAALYQRGNVNHINNNFLGLNNGGMTFTSDTTDTPNTACSLALFALSANANNYANSIVSGNIFSRRELDGDLSTSGHKINSVFIDPMSEPGLLVDNIFTDDTVSGVVSPMVEEDQVNSPVASATTRQWTVERNKNMLETTTLSFASGDITVGTFPEVDFSAGTLTTAVLANNYVETNLGLSVTRDATIVFTDASATPTDVRYRFKFDLNKVLPLNVEIVSVTLEIEDSPVLADASTTAESKLSLIDNDGISYDSTETINLASHPSAGNGNITHTLIEATDFASGLLVTNPSAPTLLVYQMNIDDNGTVSIRPGAGSSTDTRLLKLEITYRW